MSSAMQIAPISAIIPGKIRSQSLFGEVLCWFATQVLAKAQKPLGTFRLAEGVLLRELAGEDLRAIAGMNGDYETQSAVVQDLRS